MELRFERALADSIRARILTGWRGSRPLFRVGRWCSRKSVTQCRSDAELTFGMMMVSRCGDLHCRASKWDVCVNGLVAVKGMNTHQLGKVIFHQTAAYGIDTNGLFLYPGSSWQCKD